MNMNQSQIHLTPENRDQEKAEKGECLFVSQVLRFWGR